MSKHLLLYGYIFFDALTVNRDNHKQTLRDLGFPEDLIDRTYMDVTVNGYFGYIKIKWHKFEAELKNDIMSVAFKSTLPHQTGSEYHMEVKNYPSFQARANLLGAYQQPLQVNKSRTRFGSRDIGAVAKQLGKDLK